jgi:hypothetical protein
VEASEYIELANRVLLEVEAAARRGWWMVSDTLEMRSDEGREKDVRGNSPTEMVGAASVAMPACELPSVEPPSVIPSVNTRRPEGGDCDLAAACHASSSQCESHPRPNNTLSAEATPAVDTGRSGLLLPDITDGCRDPGRQVAAASPSPDATTKSSRSKTPKDAVRSAGRARSRTAETVQLKTPRSKPDYSASPKTRVR